MYILFFKVLNLIYDKSVVVVVVIVGERQGGANSLLLAEPYVSGIKREMSQPLRKSLLLTSLA